MTTHTSAAMTSAPLPRIAQGLQVVASSQEPPQHTLFIPASRRFVRMGNREWSLLQQLDGATPLAALAARLALPEAHLVALLSRFRQLGLLETADTAAARSSILWSVEGAAVARRLAPVVRRIRIVALIGVLVAIAAAIVTVPGVGAPVSPWNPGAGPWGLLLAVAAMVPAIAFHELAHAAVLIRCGGMPRRLGIRLRGAVPVGFCDISDAWSLPSRPQRAAVAAAGIAAHIVLAAVALVAADVFGDMHEVAVASCFACFAVLNLVCATGSALPLHGLDGNLGLSLAMDIPNLRSRSVMYAKSLILAAILRRPASPPPDERRIWLAYGLIALVAPTVVGAGVVLARPLFLAAGARGAAAWLTLVGAGLTGSALRLWPTVRMAWRMLAARRRGTAAVAGVLALAAFIHLAPIVPTSGRAGCSTIDHCLYNASLRPALREIGDRNDPARP